MTRAQKPREQTLKVQEQSRMGLIETTMPISHFLHSPASPHHDSEEEAGPFMLYHYPEQISCALIPLAIPGLLNPENGRGRPYDRRGSTLLCIHCYPLNDTTFRSYYIGKLFSNFDLSNRSAPSSHCRAFPEAPGNLVVLSMLLEPLWYCVINLYLP